MVNGKTLVGRNLYLRSIKRNRGIITRINLQPSSIGAITNICRKTARRKNAVFLARVNPTLESSKTRYSANNE
jgi:hypothetical protein